MEVSAGYPAAAAQEPKALKELPEPTTLDGVMKAVEQAGCEVPCVAEAIQTALGRGVSFAPERGVEQLAPVAAETAGGPGGAAINDKVVDRLMRSLEDMEDDYARTVAAEVKGCQVEPLPPADLDPDEPACLAAPVDGCNAADSDGASSSRGEEEDGGGAYMTIGSDDGNGSASGLDDELESSDQAAKQEANANNGGWPSLPADEEPDFQDFQGNPLENFADFGSSNPLLPPPPPGLTLWETTPLTDTEVQLIKDTMKQVEPSFHPSWARNLKDSELQRMVRAALAAG